MEVWVFDRKVNNRNVWFFIIDDCNDEISLLYLLLLVISIIEQMVLETFLIAKLSHQILMVFF